MFSRRRGARFNRGRVAVGVRAGGPPPDVTAPELVSAVIDAAGTSLTLTYDEALDDTSEPDPGDYTLNGAVLAVVTAVNVTGSTVVLTLSPAVADLETGLTLDYTPGAAPVQDLAGNDAAALAAEALTNNSTVVDPILYEADGAAEYDFALSTVTVQDASVSDGSAFDQASWTKTETTITANADGVADRVTVNVAATTPTVAQTVSNAGVNSALNPPMVFVVDVSSADVTWILIETRSGTAANRVWFRIDGTPGVGTTGANLSAASNSDAGGGYRRLAVTMNANAGAAIFSIRPTSADGVLTTSGDGTSFLAKNASVTQRRVSAITNRKTGDAGMAQGTASLQLGYEATGLNGGPCCAGYGSQYLISTEAAAVAPVAGTDKALTVFVVAQNVASADVLQAFFGCGAAATATNSTRVFGMITTGTGRLRASHIDDAATNLGVEAAGNLAAGTNAFVAEYYTSGTAMSIQENGAAADPDAGSANGGATTCDRISIGSRPDSSPDTMLGTSPGVGSRVALIAMWSTNKDSASRSRIRVAYGARKSVTVTP